MLSNAVENGDMEDIEKFALALHACAKLTKDEGLETVSEQILVAVESFDVQECENLLANLR